MIKVQREVKEKSTRLMELQEKYTLLESVSECVDVKLYIKSCLNCICTHILKTISKLCPFIL
jgi:hypothetical protein